MFKQLKNQDPQSGAVLLLTLMSVIVIMFLTITMLSQRTSQTKSTQQQVDQIRADLLAKGYFWNAYSNGMATGNITGFSVQNRLYNITMTPGVNSSYVINVVY